MKQMKILLLFLLNELLLLSLVQCDEYHQMQNKINLVELKSENWVNKRKDVEEHLFGDFKNVKMHPEISARSNKDAKINQDETKAEFWYNKANEELNLALKLQNRKKKVAKNVILFLGDGMATASITAGRILKGQNENKLGAEAVLSMDLAEHMGLSKTYNVDHQVPDSAGTATAYLTGVKTHMAVIGLTAAITPGLCNTTKGEEVQSVLMDSHYAGKSTGIVTTTRLNHATPSGAYAHSATRYWYDDTDLTEEAIKNGCTDIAYQLYSTSSNIEVLLGGGRKHFRPNSLSDEEYPDKKHGRGDGQDLVAKWQEKMKNLGRSAKYVWNKKDFDNIDPYDVDHLLGMFEPTDMQYEVDRNKSPNGEPSLSEMTEKAIQILRKNEKGYFLLVEGGRIDHAHHNSNAYRALHETVEFDNAIAKARQMTSSSDTLIIVTADHGHTFTFAGYPERGNPIFGLAADYAADNKTYTGLLYGNGEGYQGTGEPNNRENLTTETTGSIDYKQQSAVPKDSETHGGDDIPILASGPMSHLFHSVHEQSYIAHVMRYASCVGGVTELCEEIESSEDKPIEFLGYQLNSSTAETALNAMFGLEIIFFLVAIGLLFFYNRLK